MRVAENLNQSLHTLLEAEPRAYVLGEDIADPYGGAFKVTKGLSDSYPGRVLTTPISESGIVGAGAGLALAGDVAIVEIMFGDFAALAFDQIVNFASKSVSMYGRRVPMPLVARCPMGGRRGYGATHSQSLQKHFIGAPGLSLYELSPFRDSYELLSEIVEREEPAMLFEDKVLYTSQMFTDGVVDDLLSFDRHPQAPDVARVFVDDPDRYDVVLIAAGGMAHRACEAVRDLLVEEEITALLLVPTRLYPFAAEPLLGTLGAADVICVAEEGTAGGTWGAEVAQQLHQRLWGTLRRPVRLVHSADSVIPSAAHLEERVLVSGDTIRQAVVEALRD